MESKINAFRKSFGNLAEIYCEFKDCVDDSDYKNYVSEIAQDFLDNPRVNSKIIPCPKNENSMKMIRQSIPFDLLELPKQVVKNIVMQDLKMH